MDPRGEVSDFLTSRRHAITPARVGLTAGPRRRVPGLRRGEVADLAGLSVEYFSRLERGEVKGATQGVLDAIAGALLLDADERAHLHALVAAVRRPGPASRTDAPAEGAGPGSVRPGVLQMVESITAPALLVNQRTDVVAANVAARRLYAEMFAGPAPVNYACFVFTGPAAGRFFPDWESAADEVVATLHHAVGCDPADARLTSLVTRLRRDDVFDRRWQAQTVRRRTYGTKQLCHSEAGELTLSYETLQLPAEPELALMVYSAAPGSPSAEALGRLGESGGPPDPTSMSSISTPSGSQKKQ